MTTTEPYEEVLGNHPEQEHMEDQVYTKAHEHENEAEHKLARSDRRSCIGCINAPAGIVALVLIALDYGLEIAILENPWYDEDRWYFATSDKVLWTAAIVVFFLVLCCVGIYVKYFHGHSSSNQKQQQKQEEEETPVHAVPKDSPPTPKEWYPIETGGDGDDGNDVETPIIERTPVVVSRSIAMDLLKVIMVFAVLINHSMAGVLTFDPDGAFVVQMGTESVKGVLPVFIVGLPIYMGAMPLFFFISGLYTMRAFNRKGCAQFVLQKLQRLLLPTIVVTYLLNPLMLYLRVRIADVEFTKRQLWKYILSTMNPGQTWFCLHLVLANLGFAAVWCIKPGATDVRMRQWFGRNLRLDWTLYLWALGLGVIVSLEYYFTAGGVTFLDRGPDFPWDTFSARIVYVLLGTYAGYAEWHEQIQAFARASKSEVVQCEQLLKTRRMMKYSVWMLVIMILATFGMVGVRIGIQNDTVEAALGTPSSSFLITALQCIFGVLATLPSVLLMVYLSYRWLDIRPNAFTKFLVRSMYAVFILHTIVLPCIQWLWIEILRGVFGMAVEYDVSVFSFVGLSDGTLVASFFFIFIVTNLIVWPLSYIICRLPLLNRIL